MKQVILIIFALISIQFSARSQSYDANDVDKMAMPINGAEYLKLFIDQNLQMPFLSKLNNISGDVLLEFDISEKGTTENIVVKTSLRKDCDDEAIRVLKSFNAWQPALLGGKKVKQKSFQKFTFNNTEKINFLNGFLIEYLDKNLQPNPSSDQIAFSRKTPIDFKTGIPNGDIEIYLIKKDVPEQLVATMKMYKYDKLKYTVTYPDSLSDSTHTLSQTVHKDKNFREIGTSRFYYENGQLQKQIVYNNGIEKFPMTEYYDNGVVKTYSAASADTNKIYTKTTWYSNGQLAEHVEYTSEGMKLINQWSEDGKQTVKNGNGIAYNYKYEDVELLTETGKYVNYKKEGNWVYSFSTGDIVYKENYSNGLLIKGVAFWDLNDSTTYKGATETLAEFKGGNAELKNFMNANLKYPEKAFNSKIQGKTHIQFTINEGGQIVDLKILKSSGNLDLDTEAVRVVKSTAGKWNCATKRGRKASSSFSFPVTFSITETQRKFVTR
ncbi:MAG: TonB family protein [Pseudarcicella sp.]|nr:TonB family protein [Pseudarcicella sp.]MBP6411315.1 TonB family protein [Pseudarcicella sp.]